MVHDTREYFHTIRCDTDEILFIGRTYRDAFAYCHTDAVAINGLSQSLALDGRPAIRIDHPRATIGTGERAIEIDAESECGLTAAWRIATCEAAHNLLEPRCEWWLLCENPATTSRRHPVLGAVAICNRCNARVEELA